MLPFTSTTVEISRFYKTETLQLLEEISTTVEISRFYKTIPEYMGEHNLQQ